MIYSQIYLRRKTNKLLIIAAVFAVATSFVVLFSRHKSVAVRVLKEKLANYEIANLGSTQVSVFWESRAKEAGWIEYGTDRSNMAKKAFDDRDLEGAPQSYIYHLATMDNLLEDTVYYYRIVTLKGAYAEGGNTDLHFRTQKKNTQIISAKPAYGKVLLPNGNPKDNILVRLQVAGYYPLVVLSKQTGEWLMPLGTLTSHSDPKNTPALAGTTKAGLDFFYDEGKATHIDTLVANITPLSQTILLGRDYSLLAQSTVMGAETAAGEGQKNTFMVVYPRENGLIPGGKPLIKGTGVPGADVFIFINSTPQYAYRTTVDNKGEWRVQPTQDIGAGSYVAAITSRDSKGGRITINRNFIIGKSGEQVLGVATGEPTLAPSPLPSPTIALPTGSPTAQPSPTIIVYISPTVMPTAGLNYPTVTPAPPRTGGNFSYLLIVGIAFLVTGGGLMLVF